MVNLWELVLNGRKPGVLAAGPLSWWDKYVTGSGSGALANRPVPVVARAGLAEIHQDPFDRLFVAQAVAEKLAEVSEDEMLGRYGVAVVWE